VVAAIFGIIIGLPVLRLRGDYLAIVTLAFGEIIKGIIQNLEITGGAAGLKTSKVQDATFITSAILVLITVFHLLTQNL
jgi:branched-chain amino acid transport system permease protein